MRSPISPISISVPSITEEYSITAVLQRNGITGEIIKRWAAEILVALDSLHRNGVICRYVLDTECLLDTKSFDSSSSANRRRTERYRALVSLDSRIFYSAH